MTYLDLTTSANVSHGLQRLAPEHIFGEHRLSRCRQDGDSLFPFPRMLSPGGHEISCVSTWAKPGAFQGLQELVPALSLLSSSFPTQPSSAASAVYLNLARLAADILLHRTTALVPSVPSLPSLKRLTCHPGPPLPFLLFYFHSIGHFEFAV